MEKGFDWTSGDFAGAINHVMRSACPLFSSSEAIAFLIREEMLRKL